ncbi:uncharacterized protein N7496_006469 [Penicillium cataractarum]|uniref:Uncharacterized protein n=1 Tax=Penicillium cataractarum TaxID=2100454 RepID=A0A9W9V6C1_9EURO|nr:uncharacterized protein N7496_006469 [Penicillium cataractarum]KAJ5370377.1 hypothetical protein N7496_006469 [Penicillium cataractarum]
MSLSYPVRVAGVMGYPNDHYSEYVDELPEQDLYDENPDDPGVSTLHEPESPENNQEREESELRQKDLYDRCSYILGQLEKGQRRWSDEKDENQSATLLEPYKKAILIETDERDREHPSLLHALARRWNQYHTENPIVRKAIIYIIEKAPKNGVKEAPIWLQAVSHGHLEFIKFIKQHCPAHLPEILAMQDDKGQNFFHHLFYLAIRDNTNQQRKETLDRAKEYFPHATAQILAAQDKEDNNTPIHYALHPQQCLGRGQEYVKLAKEMVQRADKLMERGAEFNRLGQSPYQYCLVHSAQRKMKMNPPKPPITAPNDPIQDVKRLNSNLAEETKSRPTTVAANVKAPLGGAKIPSTPPMPMASIPGATISRNSMSVDSNTVESMLVTSTSNASVPRAPMAPPVPPDRGRSRAVVEGGRQGSRPQSVDQHLLPHTPGTGLRRAPTNPSLVVSVPGNVGLLMRQGVAEAKSQNRKDPEQSMNHLLLYLHLHYIRQRPDLIARELIYGKHACERNLYFDAISLEDKEPSQIVDLISRLSIGGFDKILSYVRIPTTKMSAPAQQAPKKELKSYVKRTAGTVQGPIFGENPNPGRQSLVSVFDELYEAGVRRIIRLYVDDMVPPHHSDAAIERAISGRDSLGLEKPRKETGCRIMVETW